MPTLFWSGIISLNLIKFIRLIGFYCLFRIEKLNLSIKDME